MDIKQLIKNAAPKSFLSAHRNIKKIRDWYNRNLSKIQIYTTNRCNSQCLHCNIWKIQPKVDLQPDIFSEILRSKCISTKTSICLEGGEFFLHPHCEEILRLFAGRQINLITNGILTDRICSLTEKFSIKSLKISLDGDKETYKKMRGVDAYDDVIKTIKYLKDKVAIKISFTASPYNDIHDYEHVKKLSAELDLDFDHIGNIYTNQPYFATTDPVVNISERFKLKEHRELDTAYLVGHDKWLGGAIKLPCFSILGSAIIYPEGDVYFCHHRKALLGNLYKQSLDQIWFSKNTLALQKNYIGCNDCWCSFHREYDIENEHLEKTVMNSKILKTILRLQ